MRISFDELRGIVGNMITTLVSVMLFGGIAASSSYADLPLTFSGIYVQTAAGPGTDTVRFVVRTRQKQPGGAEPINSQQMVLEVPGYARSRDGKNYPSMTLIKFPAGTVWEGSVHVYASNDGGFVGRLLRSLSQQGGEAIRSGEPVAIAVGAAAIIGAQEAKNALAYDEESYVGSLQFTISPNSEGKTAVQWDVTGWGRHALPKREDYWAGQDERGNPLNINGFDRSERWVIRGRSGAEYWIYTPNPKGY